MCITFIATSFLRTCSASSAGEGCPRASAGPNSKVFGQAFFKKLAGRGVPVAHELAPTEPAGEKRRAGGTRMSAGLISRFGRCFLFATGKPHPSRQARLQGRRPLLFCAARCARRGAQCEAEKGRASQKQRSEFLAAPFHMAPPGRQKSEREFCLFGGVLFVRRAAPYGRLAVLARPAAVMRAFVPGAPAFFLQALHTRGDSLAPSVLFACRALCAHIFLLSFIFPVWLLPLKSLFTCRSGRDGPFLACPLPRLCFRPAGLVTCCFFAGFCTHCLFACSALFMRVFSLLFFCPFLPNFFLSNFFSFVAQAATGLYFLPKRK